MLGPMSAGTGQSWLFRFCRVLAYRIHGIGFYRGVVGPSGREDDLRVPRYFNTWLWCRQI